MTVSRRVVARTIADKLQAGESTEAVMQQLAAYMSETHTTKQQDEMINDIASELARRGVCEVTVTTARPLSDELRAMVNDFVAKREDVKDVTIDERIDESIIGGIVIEAPSWRYDASVAAQIKKLRTT